MASNKTTVNYNKIKISFSENLVKLHRVALENADRVNSLNLNLLTSSLNSLLIFLEISSIIRLFSLGNKIFMFIISIPP